MEKKKRRNKSDLGDNFIAPDGGWGWIVCVAAGFVILSILPIWQSFGLIFRDRLLEIGLTNYEITTIINIQPAVTSCIGLFSGAIFRRFSYRQVSIFSGILVSIGIMLASISNSFIEYVCSISVIFGSGMGLGTISTFITINIYFQKKRRRARSFTLTISSIGAIFVPHLANYLILLYDVQGTVMIFGAISMHSFAFALLYQPIKWHSNKLEKNPEELLKLNEFSESTEKENCKTEKELNNKLDDKNNIDEINILMSSLTEEIKENEDPLVIKDSKNIQNESLNKPTKCFQKLTKFFDLDLLKDLIYVNLIIGITLTGFSEQNFSLLIPFFLSDFQFSKTEIAMAMSILAIADLITRFLIPFFTDQINWNNRIYFLIGVIGGTFGRIIIAQIPKFNFLLIMFGFMGICKALRIIFVGLVVPDHVPLKRLPAAVGLRHFSNGIFTIIFGPIVGIIRDSTNPTFMLYFLSFISMIPVITWSIELTYTYIKKLKELNKLKLEESKEKCDIIYKL